MAELTIAQRENLREEGIRALAWIEAKVSSPEVFFGRLIRQAADEVIDGARTGRWSIGQLEPTEKTFIGTKLEILIRRSFGMEAQPRSTRTERRLDLVIEGAPVDVKFSIRSVWMIPEEARDQLCILVGSNEAKGRFKVGFARAEEKLLRAGKNKDKKTSFSADGSNVIVWLVPDAKLPSNFIAQLSEADRQKIFRPGATRQERVRTLFELCPRTPIPRAAIEAVAQAKDPLRRTRKDKYNPEGLGDIEVFGGKYRKKELALLGIDGVHADEWVGVPRAEYKEAVQRAKMSLAPDE